MYLGLVLVGATPQLLAQAAMTRQFNVKDEAEVKDDLDKKPDDCEKLAAKVREKQQRFPIEEKIFFSYSNSFSSLVSSLKQLNAPSFSLHSYTYGDIGLPSGVGFWDSGNRPVLVSGKARRKLDGDILALSRLFPAAILDGKERFQFELSFDDTGVVTTSKILRHDAIEAHQAFIAYDAIMDLWRCTPKNKADDLISKNSEITWSNNQVVVVTRLPRAGLDALLAKVAK